MPTLSKYLKFIAALIIFTVMLSCSGFKRPAIGADDVILVLADETIFDTHKPQLEEIFTDPIWTPMKEERFEIRRITMDEFKEGLAKYKNLILLANMDTENAETQFIKKFFSRNVIDGVRNGDYFYVQKEDIWAKDQTVLFLMDSKNIYLGGYLSQFREKMFGIFNDKMLADVKNRLFDRYNNNEAQKYTKEKYNIDIFVPHDFIIINEGKSKDKFIRYRRFNPDRWLTIMRTEYDNEMSFQENIIQTRDRIGKQFGDSVKVNRDILSFEPDTTYVEDGLKAEGIWEYSEGGGPFFTHAFIRNGSFYFIDGAVFAPSKKKYPYMIQLELMAQTVKFLEFTE